VSDENEGGPFSIAISNLVELLEAIAGRDEQGIIEKERIINTILEFKKEKSKVAGPIVERKFINN
jgi:hypothetical protein